MFLRGILLWINKNVLNFFSLNINYKNYNLFYFLPELLDCLILYFIKVLNTITLCFLD